MDEEEYKIRVEEQLLNSVDFVDNLNIDLIVCKTDHAKKRQKRHSSDITDKEISATIKEVSNTIKKKILKNKLTPSDELIVKDHVYNLNLVIRVEKKSNSLYELLIKTVMLSRNFKPNSDQEVIDIFNS